MKTKYNLQIILAIIGLILIIYYIWFRFIRERLPRDFPFTLNILSTVTLLFLCCIYIYIIWRYFKPKNPNIQFMTLLNILLSKIYLPFKALNTLLQAINVIKYSIEIIIKLFTNLQQKYNLYEYSNSYALVLIYTIFIRILFPIIFFLDVFYFHQIALSYSFIVIGIIPIIFNYMLLENYSKVITNNFYILIIDDNQNSDYFHPVEDLQTDENNCLELQYFLMIQASALQFEYSPYKYQCIETWKSREAYGKEHNIQISTLQIFIPNADEISILLAKNFYELMPIIINIHTFLDNYKEHTSNEEIKRLNIFAVLIYLLCWVYILIVSIHTLNLEDLFYMLDNTWKDILEPFTNVYMDLQDTTTNLNNEKH